MTTPTYDLIETTTLTASASSVTFTSITQDYRDLVLVCKGVWSNDGRTLVLTLNNDSNLSSYAFQEMYGQGSSDLQGDLDNSGPYFFRGYKAVAIVDIFDYSQPRHKNMLFRTGASDTGFSSKYLSAVRYKSTLDITQIKVALNADNLEAGSTFSLYGIAA